MVANRREAKDMVKIHEHFFCLLWDCLLNFAILISSSPLVGMDQ